MANPLPSPAPAPDDALRLRRIRRMRRWATGLLIGMGVVFLVVRPLEGAYTWLAYVRAFSEAALVGALADWFAVTALFRRPLGLPIPHTAVIPEKKERIALNIGRFVQRNFLSDEVLDTHLTRLDTAGVVRQWLAQPANRQALVKGAATLLPEIARRLPEQELQHRAQELLAAQAAKTNLGPLAADLMRALMQQGQHQVLLNELLAVVADAFQANRQLLRAQVREQSPWFVPGFVDESVYGKIVQRVQATLKAVTESETHPLRAQFDAALVRFTEQLRHSENVRLKLEDLKTDLLKSPQLAEAMASIWGQLNRTLQTEATDPHSALHRELNRAVDYAADHLLDDPEVQQRLNTGVQQALRTVVQGQREAVAQLITDTVNRWDARTLSDKLELQVGRDLQFIRINGTLVGGAVGLLLHLLGQWLA